MENFSFCPIKLSRVGDNRHVSPKHTECYIIFWNLLLHYCNVFLKLILLGSLWYLFLLLKNFPENSGDIHFCCNITTLMWEFSGDWNQRKLDSRLCTKAILRRYRCFLFISFETLRWIFLNFYDQLVKNDLYRCPFRYFKRSGIFSKIQNVLRFVADLQFFSEV